MERRVDWTSWDEWQRIWEKWERLHTRINMDHIQFVDLYNLFMREVERLRREVPEFDPATLDLEGILSPDLTYKEAKQILLSVMHKPPTEEEYSAMYESYKHELEKQVEEKYPEVVAEWRKKIEELEKETERFPKVERERAKFKKLAEDLRYQLEETIRRHEEEKKALEKRVAPVKLRILKAFREGIVDYTPGSIVQTRDIDWALGLIEKGLAERVAVEVPVEVKPPAPPTAPPEEIFKRKIEFTRELERKLRDIFETTLRVGLPEEKLPGLSPYRFIPEFRLELDAIKTLPTETEMIRAIEELAKSIIRRESKPAPPAPPKLPLPPGWRETENGYLTPEGEFVPKAEFPRYVRPPEPTWKEWEAGRVRVEEEWVGPHVIRLEEWVREVLHKSMEQFDELPIEQVKLYVEQYREYLKRRYGVS
jgi:hypothetical protein